MALYNIVCLRVFQEVFAMFFDPNYTLVLRDLMPWAGAFFSLLTELGSDTFYVALILIGFWAFRKKESVLVGVVLLTSLVLNYVLKLAIANPRPDSSYWYEDIEATNYSTPSGHAQNSATLFGWFSAKVRTWWMLVISIVLTLLIGISRVYLGVHYLGDVLLGWGIGLLTVVILMLLEKPIAAKLERFKQEQLWGLFALVGLILLLVLSYLTPLPPGDNFGAIGGVMIGLAIGVVLEKRYVDFSVEPPGGQKWKLVLRVILGLILVMLLLAGLSAILPTDIVLLRATRYGLVTFVGIFVWPLIFNKLRI